MREHLASLVEEFLRHSGDIAVVSHRGVRRYPTSYAELANLAGRFAAELRSREIAPGERVVIWGENSAAWIGVFFGCMLRGIVVVPLDAAGSAEFAERVLAEVQPRLIVGDSTLLQRISNTIPALHLPPTNYSDFELPAEPDYSVDAAVRGNAPFQIVFTSGTTSAPKGIVHTHRNVLASVGPIEAEMEKYRRMERWVHPLRFLHTLPLSHVFGQFMGLWLPPLLAAEVHFTDSLAPARTIELIRRERISVLIAVPRILDLLRAHLLRRFPSLPAALDAAATRSAHQRWWRFRAIHGAFGFKFWAVISGGASLPAELELFWNRLGFALIQGYGMTETAALVTLNHPFKIGQGTIGKPLPGREVKLSDTGEILVRGDMVSSATWERGAMRPREGEWLATGDLAEQTSAGDIRFVGRRGDAIVTASGLNIHPADLEAAMLLQAGVRGCAVIGCDLPAGMEPVCVVLTALDESGLQAAVRAANQGLAESQQIRRVLRWPEIDFPYTSTGKLLRRQIREWACAALQGARPNAVEDPLLSLIAEITGAAPEHGVGPRPDDPRLSEDLHLDSLGRVQLASAIEQRVGVELDSDSIARLGTLGELRRVVGSSDNSGAGQAVYPLPTAAGDTDQDLPRRSASQIAPAAELPEEVKRPAAAKQHRYPRWPWSPPVHLLRTVALETIFRPLIWATLAPRVTKAPQLPSAGPVLIIANHVTLLDAPLVLYALPSALRRNIAIAMSGEMLLDFRAGRGQATWWGNLFAPAAYWLITALFNAFPLPRLQGFKRSFDHAGQALDRGYSVMIFPEGTRSHNGTLATFRSGTGLLATQAAVPVLPVALLGLETLHFGRGGWSRTGRVQIRVGSPVTLPEGASPAAWTERLRSELQQLLRL